MKSNFINSLVIEEYDNSLYRVHEPFIYESEILNTNLTIPEKFKIDFPLIKTVNESTIIHSYLYFIGVNDRKTCDLVFLESMKVQKINKFKRYFLYFYARILGVLIWNKYRRKIGKLTILKNYLVYYTNGKKTYFLCLTTLFGIPYLHIYYFELFNFSRKEVLLIMLLSIYLIFNRSMYNKLIGHKLERYIQ